MQHWMRTEKCCCCSRWWWMMVESPTVRFLRPESEFIFIFRNLWKEARKWKHKRKETGMDVKGWEKKTKWREKKAVVGGFPCGDSKGKFRNWTIWKMWVVTMGVWVLLGGGVRYMVWEGCWVKACICKAGRCVCVGRIRSVGREGYLVGLSVWVAAMCMGGWNGVGACCLMSL